MFFQVIIEPLDMDGLQFGNPDITKSRNDVVLNDIRVAGNRIGPDRLGQDILSKKVFLKGGQSPPLFYIHYEELFSLVEGGLHDGH